MAKNVIIFVYAVNNYLMAQFEINYRIVSYRIVSVSVECPCFTVIAYLQNHLMDHLSCWEDTCLLFLGLIFGGRGYPCWRFSPVAKRELLAYRACFVIWTMFYG